MSLDVRDLSKIEELLLMVLGKRIDVLEKNQRKILKRVGNLEDGVAEIRNVLDTEHEFRYKKLEETAEQTEKNTKDIRILNENLNITM